jgi:hypothetical protein
MGYTIADYLLAPAPRYAEFLDRATVERLVTQHRQGATGDSHLLTAILMLEVWLDTYLPRATGDSVRLRGLTGSGHD